MSTLLGRLGGAAAARPWRTVVAWVLLIGAIFGSAQAFGGEPRDNYRVPGTRSTAGMDLLNARFPDSSGTSARVVVHDRGGRALPAEALAGLRERLAGLPHALSVTGPIPSRAGDTALLTVGYDVKVTDFKGSAGLDALRAAARSTTDAGYQVEFGGELPENFSAPNGTAEAIGMVAALVILVLALGTVIAAGLPLLVALAGLGAGTGLITLLSAVTDISGIAPTVASMVGLGVGIDYALLLVSRHVEGLRRGLDARAAAAEANATAGSSVVVAGATVLVSLFGLKLAGLSVYASFGYATFATVGAVMAAALTLVPALAALAGPRLLRRAERRAPAAPAAPATAGGAGARPGPTRTERWARLVGRRPVAAAVLSLAVLLGLAAPMLGMRTWPQDAGSQASGNTTRKAYDLIAGAYGPGANGPLLLAVDLRKLPESELPALEGRMAADPGVAAVQPARFNAARDAAVISVQPTTGPQDRATAKLLQRLRGGGLPTGVEATGTVAAFSDISDRLSQRLWVVVPFVVALSLILLTVLFRAPVIAVKAAAMNLLSVAAAYGVMTAVFQHDASARLLGLPHAVPVSSWVPILMFTILFGLSMDYEVFLLSRVREDWLATGDARGSVVRGLSSTGRVISSAAAIMVAVFTGFAIDPDITVKMIGVGMAAAVLVDATVVRMVLVPATMTLLGRRNWWLPGWLDRLLPELRVEPGEAPAPAAQPVPA
ncbi:MMPL family transporter [Kitasatospora sp. YST-16]|uniref:MMPL family transporter n=1 Tax=unclassified Kitasatospora TaxID=2633591 RepID=UPI00068C51E8|nr:MULTISPECIES: MMPL family transporter [unclassified Kitasatospora]WAL75197.1 MMPL family transporter [Kitasatospora sp. YST-16]WNW41254.1 MMPL family transporter [Streptomyces sp. Li-HN-5-13]